MPISTQRVTLSCEQYNSSKRKPMLVNHVAVAVWARSDLAMRQAIAKIPP
jgi:hypothetical protein